jgi:hypothetical protein
MHEYKQLGLSNIGQITEQNLYPIGTIEFVTKYLNSAYSISQENPIELPIYLRTDEFLKRDYNIVTYDKIPKHGKFFLKDASQLKKFGQTIFADYFITDELFENTSDYLLTLSKEHNYIVSSLFNIKSEYRVYVLQGTIENIICYDGDCTIHPDIVLIKKAVDLINLNEKWLRSYTIDVMVGSCGTALIEVNNFASVGLYSTLWGDNLLYAYKDGIDYLVNDNHKLIVG